jgi:phosphoglycolate phosphatase
MKYSLLVFDWDGTLIDSAAAIAICIQEAARELGLPVPSREDASHVIGLGLADSLRHACRRSRRTATSSSSSAIASIS